MWSAPARVNLIGEHTDYNGGEVLPIAIELRTYVAVRAIAGEVCSIVSNTVPRRGEFSRTSPTRASVWWDYVAGVVAELRALDRSIPALQIAVSSDIPVGAGLGSSAALEVAAAFAIKSASGFALDDIDTALLAHRAESDFVGVQCGIMDQFVSAMAHKGSAMHLCCNDAKVRHVPFERCVLILDTTEPRALRTSLFNQRRAECSEALQKLRVTYPELGALADATPEMILDSALRDDLRRRALHVATETRRVRQAATSLDMNTEIPCDLLYESHESLRMNYECSTLALDWFVERARRNTRIQGARLTGAGWGGCAIAIGERHLLAAWSLQVSGEFRQEFGRDARTWLTNAAEGARNELQ